MLRSLGHFKRCALDGVVSPENGVGSVAKGVRIVRNDSVDQSFGVELGGIGFGLTLCQVKSLTPPP